MDCRNGETKFARRCGGGRNFQGKDAYVRKVFQEELAQVGEQLVEISKLVSEAIDKATTSFEGADVDLAQDVIAADARIDFLQNSLDERAIDILALQGPVASDLRMIVGSLRMSASLERMGDLARHIAQLARLRFPSTVIPASLHRDLQELRRTGHRRSRPSSPSCWRPGTSRWPATSSRPTPRSTTCT